MTEDSILWGLAHKRVKWQLDVVTGKRRPIQNYYLAEEKGYKHPPQQNLRMLEEQMSEIASWWKELNGWWFSGAPSISLQCGYDRTHTNLDIGVMRNPSLINKMTEQAEKRGYYWFERKASWKLLPGSDTKQELLEPINPHQLVYDLRPNRNPILLQIRDDQIMVGNSPVNHLHIHMYERREEGYYSLEDALLFPKETMITTSMQLSLGNTIRVIKPLHMLHKKQTLIQAGNKKTKHLLDITKIQKT